MDQIVVIPRHKKNVGLFSIENVSVIVVVSMELFNFLTIPTFMCYKTSILFECNKNDLNGMSDRFYSHHVPLPSSNQTIDLIISAPKCMCI